MGLEPTADGAAQLAELQEALSAGLGEAFQEISDHQGIPRVRVDASALLAAVDLLRDPGVRGCDFLKLISTVDRVAEGRLEVYYFLCSLSDPRRDVELVVWLDRDNPRVPSLTPRWDTANWQEREAYDLMGIRFQGHPDLRRILLPDVWEGYPLRKDYQYNADTMVAEVLATFGYEAREVDTWEREQRSLGQDGG